MPITPSAIGWLNVWTECWRLHWGSIQHSLEYSGFNTNVYHTQCNWMVERMNRMLKTALRKHTTQFGVQWDKTCLGFGEPIETLHTRVLERSHLSYSLAWIVEPLLEAALLPPTQLMPTEVEDYQEEVILFLSSEQKLDSKSNTKSTEAIQDQVWSQVNQDCRVGDWDLVNFPHEETGKQRKLSWPWHRPHRVVSHENPDVTVVKIYFLQETQIQIRTSNQGHLLSRWYLCWLLLVWAGQHIPGWPPQRLETHLNTFHSSNFNWTSTVRSLIVTWRWWCWIWVWIKS